MLAEIVRAWLVKIRKNSGATDVGARRRVNFIEGTNITLTLADDADDDEVDVQIAAAAHAPQAHALGGAEHSAATLAELNAKVSDATLDTSSATRDPNAHASEHTDGTDDIQDATIAQKGVATAVQITKLGGIATGADVTGSNAPQAHKLSHQDTGTDEISVVGLSGLLADDQHVLDTEVLAVNHAIIQDADTDTKIQVEEGADEDIVRMDTAGVEAFLLDAAGILTTVKQSGACAYLGTNQTITTGTWTKLVIDTELYDIQNEFDSATNYRWTCTVAGIYLVTGVVTMLALENAIEAKGAIYKNGADVLRVGSTVTGGGASPVLCGAGLLQLVATDYIELWIYHTHGSDRSALTGANLNRLGIAKVA